MRTRRLNTGLWLLVLLLVAQLAQADLPSCLRARCSHCSIQFIAQMCPSTCAECGVDVAQATVSEGTDNVSDNAPSYKLKTELVIIQRAEIETKIRYDKP